MNRVKFLTLPFIYLLSLVLWSTSILFFILIGGAFLSLSFIIPPPKLQPLGKLVCRGLLLTAGQWLRIQGNFPPRSEGPFVYAFNHASMLDTFVVIATLPEFTASIGKKEQFRVPIWGWILKRWGTVGIDRTSLSSAIHSLKLVEEAVSNGNSLLIAPEGTRSKDGTLGRLKKGPFHVAVNTGAAIIPIGILGAYEAKRKDSWLLRPGIIEVRIGSPLYPPQGASSENMEILRQQTREAFERLLQRPK